MVAEVAVQAHPLGWTGTPEPKPDAVPSPVGRLELDHVLEVSYQVGKRMPRALQVEPLPAYHIADPGYAKPS